MNTTLKETRLSVMTAVRKMATTLNMKLARMMVMMTDSHVSRWLALPKQTRLLMTLVTIAMLKVQFAVILVT